MSEKFDTILYRILPLILIIAVSWFFSFLSAKAKKQTQEAPPQQQTPPDKDPLDMFFRPDDDKESPRSSQPFAEQAIPNADFGTTAWKSQRSDAQVTPKPIEPKWWGA